MFQMEEAVAYYKKQGAPGDQTALTQLLLELQQEQGGAILTGSLQPLAQLLGCKESYLLALIKRMPRLRLAESHCLELCAGPNCTKRAALAQFVESTYGSKPKNFQLRYIPCMRMCGKGPNIRWDGVVYNGADEALIRTLVEKE